MTPSPIRDRPRQQRRRPGRCRPRTPDAGRRQCAGLRLRRDRRSAALARHPLHRAHARRELSRAARQHRQLSRQFDAADAALPARGSRRRHRPRLRQGHRQGDGHGGAFQCRPDARLDGDVQRLVRPHAGHRARRHRPGRCRQAPAVDRLDPHRARSGRAGARIHQMGRPAGLARPRRAKPSCAAPGSPTPCRRARSTSISTPSCRRRKSPSQLPAIDVARYMPQIATAAPAELVQPGGGHAQGRQAGADPRRPRFAQRGGLERPRRARRSAQRPRRDRPENRRELPDRSSALCRRAARAHAGERRGLEERRRDPEPRLGRSRRRAALRTARRRRRR